MKRALDIEVLVDFICPWCLIGRRHLLAALAALQAQDPGLNVRLRYRGVQLLPRLPRAGLPFTDFYLRRLGSAEAVRWRQAQVTAAAEAAGVMIDFGRIRVMPDTTGAHALFARATGVLPPADVDALLMRLFAIHFSEGGNLGDSALLAGVADEFGLELPDAVLPIPPEPAGTASGVPCFRFSGGHEVSGAQPPAVLLAAMVQALDTRAVAAGRPA